MTQPPTTTDPTEARGFFGWLRRLKRRVELLAESPYASWWLFGVAFVESSFFIIPPDVLLLPLAAAAPRRALRFALICTIGSVLGAVLGWYIGYLFYDTIGEWILQTLHISDKVNTVLIKYQENAVGWIMVAGFTPIPYKVFTIVAGLNETVGLPTLLGASIVGRGARFFLVAGIVRIVGPKVMPWVDRYFDILAVAFAALLIIGFIVVKALF
ncbi:MAG: DedA family protein [Candidatus Poribacteria bacterium]|nr:DedA family protein [Candidatus Poribacteria bacterium]